jgi:hypothetical protein
MVNDTTGVYIGQGLTGQATTLLFLIQPRRKCLLDYPVSRTIQTLGELINPLGQFYRDMCCH